MKSSFNNFQISILDYCRSLRLLFSLYSKKEDENATKHVEQPIVLDITVVNQEIDNAFVHFDPRTLNKVVISLQDIQTLAPCKWLNDTVIDYYFSLLLLNDSSYISFNFNFLIIFRLIFILL